MPKHSPFHSRTSLLCQSESWQEWNGYLSANTYALEHIHEYNAVRTACGVFDISPLFKYLVEGRDACRLLDRVVTRDVSQCRVGQVYYTPWCDDAGKIIDDGTVAHLSDQSYRVTAAIPTLYWLEDNAVGLDVTIADVSAEQGGLAIQGPTSGALLHSLAGQQVAELGYFGLTQAKIAGIPTWISRTGYTGDLGYEVFVERHAATDLWDVLLEAGQAYRLVPTGNTCLDMLRIEAGLILLDAEFHSTSHTIFDVQRSSPYELGLGWAVKLDKEYFVGQDALRAEKQRGSASLLVGAELDTLALEAIYADHGMPLHLPGQSSVSAVPIYRDPEGERYIGKATSQSWSPILKKYIALCRVEPGYAERGSRIYVEVSIEGRRFSVPATVVRLPFFEPERKKAFQKAEDLAR